MSPRPATLPVSALQILGLSFSASVCPTCAFAQAASTRSSIGIQARPSLRRAKAISYPRSRRHYASALASATAVNATKEIPPRLRDLYASLEALKKDAPNYLNLSRLQLALRSLESNTPTIRVAVLGLQSPDTSRRLSRLLLADALDDQGAWEGNLEATAGGDSQALLLKHGQETDAAPADALVTTLHVPSRVLQRHNMEILVSSLNIAPDTPTGSADAQELRRAALVPTAEAPSSFTGGVSVLTYPVHRAIILGDGLQGCMTLGRYTLSKLRGDEDRDIAVRLASNLPELAKDTDTDRPDQFAISILDIALAEEAIAKLRESTSNASIYERLWNKSGMPQLTQWLSKSSDPNGNELVDPAIAALVRDLVDEVLKNTLIEDVERSQRVNQSTTAAGVHQPLNESLRIWAMRAHLELRDRLDLAFTSETWSKLRWWKLFWRVDDVSMIMTEVIERSWLVEAEKAIIWLAGRSAEAGLQDSAHGLKLQPPMENGSNVSTSTNADSAGATSSSSPPSQPGAAVSGNTATDSSLAMRLPWPIQIPVARHAFQAATIPPLQSLSQALLLQTMSVVATTSALSALLYVSLPASTVYSCGAVAALGLAWSLRRVQTKWEAARSSWQADARERGRVVLKQVEESFRAMLAANEPRAPDFDTADVQDCKRAREAAERVRLALGGNVSK